jgi:hypothetical protein
MDNKRASGGFVGTAIGAVMTVIQGAHPEWFGNHPWILPVALLVLLASLLFFLTQYPWFQRMLGWHHPQDTTAAHKERESVVPETHMDAPTVIHFRDQWEKTQHLRLYELGIEASELFVPLQLEALRLAKDLRDFYASLDPFPESPAQNEVTAEDLVRYAGWTDPQGKWRQKLLHAYANRKFGERITKLMHQMGEEFEYPAYVPNYAEDLRIPGKDSIPKLAQDMEMLAIWINRKQRDEVYIKG